MSVIETKRLILREFTLDDAEFIYELLNQPAWKQYIGDRGIDSLAAARAYIENVLIASYRRHGFGLLAIELKADGALAGMCGLIKRDGLDDVDIGFALMPQYGGQGIAHEAAAATLAYSRDTLGLARIVAITSLDNQRSMQLLERLGMRYEGEIPFGDEQLRFYTLTLSSPVGFGEA